MEMAWSKPGFGLITSRAAKNKDRWKAQNRGRIMGLISPKETPRRENHRGGEGIAICCTSKAEKEYGLRSESEVISLAKCRDEKLTQSDSRELTTKGMVVSNSTSGVP